MNIGLIAGIIVIVGIIGWYAYTTVKKPKVQEIPPEEPKQDEEPKSD